MKIFLRRPDGVKKDDVEVDISPDQMIEDVKKKIQSTHQLDVYKLLNKGKSLADDRTLRSYAIQEGTVLTWHDPYYGQYLPMGVHPSLEKRKADELGDIEELAPEAKKAATAALQENLTESKVTWVGLDAATFGDKGGRRQMEDEHLICPTLRELCPTLSKARDMAVFALFDGHGGKQVAGFIKTYLAVELGNALAAEDGEAALNDKRLRKAVETAFARLDSRIATELPGCYDGCTAVVVLVTVEGTVYCANLGDSMAYLCRQPEDGEMQCVPLQLRQHKCWMMKEKERILRSGGAVENGRINGVLEVSRAFGDITLKKFGVLCTPEYMKFKIDREKDQYVLLGCDGFWNAWTAQEALEHTTDLVQTEEGRAAADEDAVDLKGVCRDLVQHVIEEKKAQDNVSVLLLRLHKK
eukprot:TRINITY_DN104480_c0_g1_i1.p1 TRINITY_DN104480_c0_g1~~TRINITY_DN104480_c0_g1_i1.p1  ORF type:complete len:412 (+),score=115.68 TRINITY_DN104480_c0_g1_i1:74-1309(+)